ncbi:MAG: protein kinase [Thermoanaerobaculia bacterium]
MTLEAGTRLGPYEILALLGAGGMGEVYRARDVRLSRDIAVKVLPAAVSADAERLRRFEKEARAASALNHPNIVTVYDIGQAATGSFIAMELVEGRTLRELVVEGPLPSRRLLGTAVQIADGLAKAHEAGIVHRDLKPENVMVTRDGIVKILDFGLAKLTDVDGTAGATKAATVSAGTGPGVVMGTVGYMSPEQASAKVVDFRSDQFAFGSILYELATGKRAFDGATAVDTLSAILHAEPEPMALANPAIPVPLRWTVDRCLAKDPEERYVSTRDLARELHQIREHSSQTEIASSAPTVRRRGPVAARTAAAVLTGAVLGAAAAWFALQQPAQHPAFRQLTFRREVIWGAAFAPDGHVVYAANTDGTRARFYDLAPDALMPSALDIDADVLADISSRGELAVLRGGHASPLGFWEGGTLARVPVTGGAPRDLVTDAVGAAWDSDGSNLAVVRSVDGNWGLEYPIGHSVPGGPYWNPRFSRRSPLLAAARASTPTAETAEIDLIDPGGRRRTLSADWNSETLRLTGWQSDGKALWLTGSQIATAESGIFTLSLSGRLERRLALPAEYFLASVGRDGSLLLQRDERQHRTAVWREGEAGPREISTIPHGGPVRISPDGKRALLSEDGPGPELYVQGTDGSAPVRLGKTAGGDFSPDGKWIVAAAAGGSSKLLRLPVGAGPTQEIQIDGYDWDGWNAAHPDGRHFVCVGSEKGGPPSFFLVDLVSKTARRIGTQGSVGPPHVSPDGLRLAYIADGHPFVVSIDGGAPTLVPGCDTADAPVGWASDSRNLYVVRLGRMPSRIDIVDTQTGDRRPWRDLTVLDPAGAVSFGGVRITPDGRTFIFGESRRYSTLYLVTGVR